MVIRDGNNKKLFQFHVEANTSPTILFIWTRKETTRKSFSIFCTHFGQFNPNKIRNNQQKFSKISPPAMSTNPGASTISGQRYRPRKQYCNNVSFSFCFAGEPPTTGILLKYAHCAHGDKLVFDRNLRSFSIYFFVPFHKRHCLQGNTIGAIIK